ncbi:hypothetical protein BJV78DRAFT_1253862 [Lactifluus subvellereus]|nr:hypothetical protein BJV78DRAFT_1253862 [Lactifluus subvellereus]
MEPSPGCVPYVGGLNPSTMVGWRCSLSRRDGSLVNPFKCGADWLVVNLAGGGAEVEAELSGDVLMGGRIGRVAAVDVETVGNDDDGPKGPVAGFFSSCTDAVDGGAPNDRPGEKAGALGLRAVAGGFCAEAETLDAGGVAPGPKLVSSTLLMGHSAKQRKWRPRVWQPSLQLELEERAAGGA